MGAVDSEGMGLWLFESEASEFSESEEVRASLR